jgi:hypothetical protein
MACMQAKNSRDRFNHINRWHNEGGVLFMGYEMYRGLVLGTVKGTSLLRDRQLMYRVRE